MANLTNNRLNVTVDAAVLAEIKESITEIKVKLPFLCALTPDEKRKMPKINVGNKVFTEDAINVASTFSHILPNYINVSGMQKDYELFEQLDVLLSYIDNLRSIIDDTKTLAGSEAYVGALACYRHFETASATGIPDATVSYELLRERFAKHGNRKQ